MLNPMRVRAILLATLASFVLAGPAAAGDFRSDGTVTVGADETVDDDLYVGAGTVSIDGTVNGDATVAGGTVTMTGTVDGSLNAGGGTVEVFGDVTGAVRVSGGTVRIVGSVGRDVVVFGGTVTVEPSAEVGGDLAGAGGSLVMGGTVHGDVLVGMGTMNVSGTVDGAIDAAVEDLVIEPSAVVGGDVTYTSANEARIADGSQIGGSVERREPADETESVVAENPIVSYLGLLVGMLLLGWGFLAIRPRVVLGSSQMLRTAPLPSLGLGAAGCLGQFVLVLLLLIVGGLLASLAGSVGGAFFAAGIVVMLLILLLLFLGVVPVAMTIGRLVLPSDRSAYLVYLAGAAILSLVLVVAGFVPGLGAIAFLCVWVLGLGAFIVYAWRTRREPFESVPPPQPPAEPAWGAPPAA